MQRLWNRLTELICVKCSKAFISEDCTPLLLTAGQIYLVMCKTYWAYINLVLLSQSKFRQKEVSCLLLEDDMEGLAWTQLWVKRKSDQNGLQFSTFSIKKKWLILIMLNYLKFMVKSYFWLQKTSASKKSWKRFQKLHVLKYAKFGPFV